MPRGAGVATKKSILPPKDNTQVFSFAFEFSLEVNIFKSFSNSKNLTPINLLQIYASDNLYLIVHRLTYLYFNTFLTFIMINNLFLVNYDILYFTLDIFFCKIPIIMI